MGSGAFSSDTSLIGSTGKLLSVSDQAPCVLDENAAPEVGARPVGSMTWCPPSPLNGVLIARGGVGGVGIGGGGGGGGGCGEGGVGGVGAGMGGKGGVVIGGSGGFGA